MEQQEQDVINAQVDIQDKQHLKKVVNMRPGLLKSMSQRRVAGVTLLAQNHMANAITTNANAR